MAGALIVPLTLSVQRVQLDAPPGVRHGGSRGRRGGAACGAAAAGGRLFRRLWVSAGRRGGGVGAGRRRLRWSNQTSSDMTAAEGT